MTKSFKDYITPAILYDIDIKAKWAIKNTQLVTKRSKLVKKRAKSEAWGPGPRSRAFKSQIRKGSKPQAWGHKPK